MQATRGGDGEVSLTAWLSKVALGALMGASLAWPALFVLRSSSLGPCGALAFSRGGVGEPSRGMALIYMARKKIAGAEQIRVGGSKGGRGRAHLRANRSPHIWQPYGLSPVSVCYRVREGRGVESVQRTGPHVACDVLGPGKGSRAYGAHMVSTHGWLSLMVL